MGAREARAREPARDNARVYGERWAGSRRVVRIRPHLWREVSSRATPPLLEIGPGLRPTIPVRGSYFIDVSGEALEVLRRRGANVALHRGGSLPFGDGAFGGVFAFEVLEHIREDEDVLREIARVLRPGGMFALSVPLHERWWTAIDDAAGHVRRYDPEDLFAKLDRAGFLVERYDLRFERLRPRLAGLGTRMLSSFPRLCTWGMQNFGYPLYAAYQSRRGRIEWRSERRPIPEETTGITVLASRANGTSS